MAHRLNGINFRSGRRLLGRHLGFYFCRTMRGDDGEAAGECTAGSVLAFDALYADGFSLWEGLPRERRLEYGEAGGEVREVRVGIREGYNLKREGWERDQARSSLSRQYGRLYASLPDLALATSQIGVYVIRSYCALLAVLNGDFVAIMSSQPTDEDGFHSIAWDDAPRRATFTDVSSNATDDGDGFESIATPSTDSPVTVPVDAPREASRPPAPRKSTGDWSGRWMGIEVLDPVKEHEGSKEMYVSYKVVTKVSYTDPSCGLCELG